MDNEPKPVSKPNSSDDQEMVSNGKDGSSALVETVTDKEPKLLLGQKASKKAESGAETTIELGSRGKFIVGVDANSRYEIALKALAKQQILL